MPRIQLPVYQNNLADGGVNSGGFLHFYENRSDPPVYKSVFLDPAEQDESLNPVELDDNGYTPELFGSGAYTVVATDQDDVQLWSRDDVVIGTSGGQFADYSPIQIYSQFAIVRAENGQYYVSLFNQNVNHEPSISPEWWSRTVILKYWNASENYSLGESVLHTGLIWLSTQNDNLNNEPVEDSEFWSATFVGMVNPMTAVGDLIVGSAEGAPVRKAIGAANTVLTSNGTTSAWEDPMEGEVGDAIAEISDKLDKQILAPIQGFQALGSVTGTVTIDLNLGNIVTLTASGNITIALTPHTEHTSSTVSFAAVDITRTTQTVTHPVGTIWSPNGIAPDLTDNGKDTILYTKYGTGPWNAVRSREDVR